MKASKYMNDAHCGKMTRKLKYSWWNKNLQKCHCVYCHRLSQSKNKFYMVTDWHSLSVKSKANTIYWLSFTLSTEKVYDIWKSPSSVPGASMFFHFSVIVNRWMCLSSFFLKCSRIQDHQTSLWMATNV